MLQLAVASDRETVNSLACQIHAMHVAWRPDLFEMVDELYPLERFSAAVERRELYVAKVGGETVGYVLLPIREYDRPGMVKRKVMVLDEICVHEAARGHGIGTQMMSEVIALACAFGCTDIQLGVYPQNEEAVAFCQKCGFTIRNINMQMKV